MRKLEPQKAVTFLGSCSNFVPEVGLELLALRSYWGPIPDPDFPVVLGAYHTPAAGTNLSCRVAFGHLSLLGILSPSSEGAELSASLPDRCGNHTLFQLVSFHCISTLALLAAAAASRAEQRLPLR